MANWRCNTGTSLIGRHTPFAAAVARDKLFCTTARTVHAIPTCLIRVSSCPSLSRNTDAASTHQKRPPISHSRLGSSRSQVGSLFCANFSATVRRAVVTILWPPRLPVRAGSFKTRPLKKRLDIAFPLQWGQSMLQSNGKPRPTGQNRSASTSSPCVSR